MDKNKCYTLPEVAELLSVSRATVYRLINGSKIPAFKIGDEWRIKAEDVEAFIEDRMAATARKSR